MYSSILWSQNDYSGWYLWIKQKHKIFDYKHLFYCKKEKKIVTIICCRVFSYLKGENDSVNILYATKNPEHYLFVNHDNFFLDSVQLIKNSKFCIHDRT